MDAMNALYDGLKSELAEAETLYFGTPGFTDPMTFGGEKQWVFFSKTLDSTGVRSNKILSGIADIYKTRITALMIPDCTIHLTTDKRKDILKQRRMVFRDFMDAVQAVRSAIQHVMRDTEISRYHQQQHGIDIEELSDQHVATITQLELQSNDFPMSIARIGRYVSEMLQEKKNQVHGEPRRLFLHAATSRRKQGTTEGYLFTKKVPASEREEHTYQNAWASFGEKRSAFEIMGLGVRHEMTDRALPDLLQNMLQQAKTLQPDRLEWQIDKYHPRY